MTREELIDFMSDSGCHYGLREKKSGEWVKISQILGQSVWVTSATNGSFFTYEEAEKVVALMGLDGRVEIEDARSSFGQGVG